MIGRGGNCSVVKVFLQCGMALWLLTGCMPVDIPPEEAQPSKNQTLHNHTQHLLLRTCIFVYAITFIRSYSSKGMHLQ